MQNILQSIDQSMGLLKANFTWVISAIAILWGIQVINKLLSYKLNVLGIHPRHPLGLIGIVFSPFLHKDFQHLFLNTIPLFILLNVLVLYGVHTAIYATIVIGVFCGLAIWLMGRKGVHIGASAIVFGYFGFALGGAFYTHNFITILAAALSLFYLGSILVGLIPTRSQVSWEGHLAGFIAGILYSYYLFG